MSLLRIDIERAPSHKSLTWTNKRLAQTHMSWRQSQLSWSQTLLSLTKTQKSLRKSFKSWGLALGASYSKFGSCLQFLLTKETSRPKGGWRNKSQIDRRFLQTITIIPVRLTRNQVRKNSAQILKQLLGICGLIPFVNKINWSGKK